MNLLKNLSIYPALIYEEFFLNLIHYFEVFLLLARAQPMFSNNWDLNCYFSFWLLSFLSGNYFVYLFYSIISSIYYDLVLPNCPQIHSSHSFNSCFMFWFFYQMQKGFLGCLRMSLRNLTSFSWWQKQGILHHE